MNSDNDHYPLKRLGDLITLEYGDTLPDEGRQGGSVPVYGSNGVVGYHNESRVSGPGIVVGRKGSIGRTAWVDGDFWPIDTTYYVKQKTGHSQRWLYNLLSTRSMERLNTATGVPGLNRDDAYALKVPVPTEEESSRIAEILTSVDEAIERTRGVIDQTRQLKTALLQDLLTQGLPGKHSEFVEHKHLGKMPADWKLVPLRSASDRITDGVHASVKTVERGHPFLYVSCVRDGKILWDSAACISDATYRDISPGRVAKPGGVLYTVVGSFGHAALVHDDRLFSFQRHVGYVETKQDVLCSAYLVHWLNCEKGRREANRIALGGAQKTITLQELGRFPVPLPPVEEQNEIVSLLSALADRVEREQNRLTQLTNTKTALSQALLTGRVRVSLPETHNG